MTQSFQSGPSSPSDQSCPSSGSAIEVLYFDGCPSYVHAVALVRQALTAERITAPIQLIRVDTDAEACHYGFYGSPTIRVNSEDIPRSRRGRPHISPAESTGGPTVSWHRCQPMRPWSPPCGGLCRSSRHDALDRSNLPMPAASWVLVSEGGI